MKYYSANSNLHSPTHSNVTSLIYLSPSLASSLDLPILLIIL